MNCIRSAVGVFCFIGSFALPGAVSAQKPALLAPEQLDLEDRFENPFDNAKDATTPQENKERKEPKRFDFKTVDLQESDDELLNLLKQRYNAAVGEVRARLEEFRLGRSPITFVAAAAARMVRSEREIEQDDKLRSEFLAEYVELTQMIEEFALVKLRSGTGTVQEVYQARHLRLDGQIQQLRHKRTLQPL